MTPPTIPSEASTPRTIDTVGGDVLPLTGSQLTAYAVIGVFLLVAGCLVVMLVANWRRTHHHDGLTPLPRTEDRMTEWCRLVVDGEHMGLTTEKASARATFLLDWEPGDRP